MTTLSVVVPLGFVGQFIHDERGNDTFGPDEFEHMAPLADAKEGVQLVIVDRNWPNRWGRVCEILGELVDREALIYAPPKPNKMIESGYRACCAMRNSGAVLSNGDILAFIDDYVWIYGSVVPEILKHYEHTGLVLCPASHPNIDNNTPEGPPSDFGGHNPGIYMCTREQFIALNGFDENLDGAYGEEDTEFQDRLDRLLWLRQRGYRQRRKGLMWPRVEHTNGDFPQRTVPFWDVPSGSWNLRCNKSYVKHVSYPRIQNNRVRGNVPPEALQLDAMATAPCSPECPTGCHREDRQQQIRSYVGMLRVSVDIAADMEAYPGPYSGNVNPW